MKNIVLTLCLAIIAANGSAQSVPSKSENVDYLVTFGKEANTSYGDEDKSQVLFFLIPVKNTQPFYIRIYDPETGGKHDEINGKANTEMSYAVYAGPKAHSTADAMGVDPKGDYKSGVLISEKKFTSNLEYDQKWFTMGPFNPVEGELVKDFGGYVYKLIVSGLSGNDGNLYKCFMSSSATENLAIEGGNTFTYEYCVRLKSRANTIAHFYPYIDKEVNSITQHNFDFDGDGKIVLYSISKNGILGAISGDNQWKESRHEITFEERGNSIDLQVIKRGDWNNDLVLYITNQYNQNVPFFSSPLGGTPIYKHKLKIEYKGK